jgi:cytochrome c2
MGHGAELSGPVIPGLHGKHPLDEGQRGELLIGELRCAACHEGMADGHMKRAPELWDVGSRLTPDFIERYLMAPHAAQPGTTMPDVLGAAGTVEERREVARSITAYLLSLGGEAAAELPIEGADAAEGRELFHGIGCVVCHLPRDENGIEVGGQGAVPLSHVADKYWQEGLASFLHTPLRVRGSGRMPDMKLSREEAAALAAYLGGAAASGQGRGVSDADRIESGRRAFLDFNCAACHQPEEEEIVVRGVGPSVEKLDLGRGCLSDSPGAAPDFALLEDQRRSIREALAAPVAVRAPADRIHMQLTRMNCIGCHERDDYGGVAEGLNVYFRSSEEALGDPSRIPPPLTLIGAKLRPEWLRGVLYDGWAVRPYMKARMPLYGEEGLEGLADLFDEVDQMEVVELPGPDRESEPHMRNGAHLLIGDSGLNCIACHNYNGKESPGMKGLDLMTSYQRLEESWFAHFMLDPGAHRPGIIMPVYWPDGKALQTEILDGDTELQLRALWHNFSLGRSARDPSGLISRPSILEVGDVVRTYRGRSRVAGYRGIAVGFPGGMSYAFNAQNGALSAIWSGGFVQVGWQGQGSGNFDPVGKPVQLAQDVAFLQMEDPEAPWPLLPQTSEEQPVNPDPLYPRNHGYAFLGYSLGEGGVPTFRYRCGPVEIEDRSVAVIDERSSTPGGEFRRIRRRLSFRTSEEETVWFRALTGQIAEEKGMKGVFRTDAVRLSVGALGTDRVALGAGEVRLTSVAGLPELRAGAEGEQELLIQLKLPEGESTISIDYELLR